MSITPATPTGADLHCTEPPSTCTKLQHAPVFISSAVCLCWSAARRGLAAVPSGSRLARQYVAFRLRAEVASPAWHLEVNRRQADTARCAGRANAAAICLPCFMVPLRANTAFQSPGGEGRPRGTPMNPYPRGEFLRRPGE